MADGYGGLGGLGGYTYPTRAGQPNSSVVPYQPNPADWAADYQTRYDAQANPAPRDYNTVVIPEWAQHSGGSTPFGGRMGQQFMDKVFQSPLDKLMEAYSKNSGVTDPALLKQARDYAIAAYKNPNGDPLTAQGQTLTPEQRAALGGVTNNADFASSLFGFDTGDYPGSGKGGSFDPNAPGASPFQQSFDPLKQTFDDYMRNGDSSSKFWGWANDQEASRNLSADRASMVPALTAATRAEQGYQQQNGWGQTNGLMGANYSDPNFGRITGDFGQGSLGAGGGAPKPILPPGSTANTIWGQAPQRVMPWTL